MTDCWADAGTAVPVDSTQIASSSAHRPGCRASECMANQSSSLLVDREGASGNRQCASPVTLAIVILDAERDGAIASAARPGRHLDPAVLAARRPGAPGPADTATVLVAPGRGHGEARRVDRIRAEKRRLRHRERLAGDADGAGAGGARIRRHAERDGAVAGAAGARRDRDPVRRCCSPSSCTRRRRSRRRCRFLRPRRATHPAELIAVGAGIGAARPPASP